MSQVYEQTGGYMPQSDDGFWHWLQNFSSLLQADPQRFAMTAADAQIVMDHFNAYTPLWTKCKQPTLRTPTLIAQKDAIKASAMGSCRVYAMLIKSAAGVTDDDKIALGLHVNDTTPTPVGVPDSAPMLNIQSAFSGEHILRYVDENTPTKRRKPYGVKFIEIYCNIAPGPNPVQDDAKPIALLGDQPIHIEQQQVNAGKTATYFGRWVNTKGEKGPWSLPVAMTIAFGGPVDQQMPAPPPGGQVIGGDDQLKLAA
jgi:hypothetical protein